MYEMNSSLIQTIRPNELHLPLHFIAIPNWFINSFQFRNKADND
jgi:hypothetical protein